MSDREMQMDLPAWRQPAFIAMAVVLALGVLLRIYFTFRWHPALVNYSDTGIYMQDAYLGGWEDPVRVVGYGLFLISMHWISPHMLPVVLLQHALGLATAVVLYLTVRRCGAPRPVAVIAMSVIVLGGTQIFLEHAILTEALFTFLVVCALYGAVRSAHDSPWWAVLAGVCLGLSVTVRGVGTVLLLLLPAWLLFSLGRPTLDTALRAGATGFAALVIVAGYVTWREAETGQTGLTTNGIWNLYGRVAPFADCTKFTPPKGTEGLCEATPPDQRGGREVASYVFNTDSPAQKLFGPPYLISPDPDAPDKLGKFTVAAIRGQPGDYLSAVWRDLTRLVAPNRATAGNLSYDEFISFLKDGIAGDGRNEFVEYWQRAYYPDDRNHRGDIGLLEDYESATRVQGPWMVIALLLAFAAPFAAPARSRSPALLMTATALALLVYPILTHAFDARFVIPALGPLFAAAGLGGWGLYLSATRMLQKRQT